jgi:hypothetical protein
VTLLMLSTCCSEKSSREVGIVASSGLGWVPAQVCECGWACMRTGSCAQLILTSGTLAACQWRISWWDRCRGGLEGWQWTVLH